MPIEVSTTKKRTRQLRHILRFNYQPTGSCSTARGSRRRRAPRAAPARGGGAGAEHAHVRLLLLRRSSCTSERCRSLRFSSWGLLPLQLVQPAAPSCARGPPPPAPGPGPAPLQRLLPRRVARVRARRLGGASGGGGGGGGGGAAAAAPPTASHRERMPSGSHWRRRRRPPTPGCGGRRSLSPPSSSSSSSWSSRANGASRCNGEPAAACGRAVVVQARHRELPGGSAVGDGAGSMSPPSSSSTNGECGLCVASARRELLLAAPAQSLERWLWPAVLAIVFAPHLGPDLAGEGARFSEMLVGHSTGAGQRRRRARGPSLPAPRPADGAEDDDGDDAAARAAARQPWRRRAGRRRCGSGSDDDDDAAAAAAAAAEAVALPPESPRWRCCPTSILTSRRGPRSRRWRTALSDEAKGASAHIARGFTAAVPRSTRWRRRRSWRRSGSSRSARATAGSRRVRLGLPRRRERAERRGARPPQPRPRRQEGQRPDDLEEGGGARGGAGDLPVPSDSDLLGSGRVPM